MSESNLKRYRMKLDTLIEERNHAVKDLAREKKRLAKSIAKFNASLKAIQITQTVAQELQTIAHDRMAGIVTQCLQDIFDEPVEFRIIWDRKRGKTEGRMAFIIDGKEVDPLSSDGGSAVEIAAFALRLANILMSPANLRKIQIKDEPFLALSEKHAEKVQEMIKILQRDLGVQFILITHNRKLRSGKIIDVGIGK